MIAVFRDFGHASQVKTPLVIIVRLVSIIGTCGPLDDLVDNTGPHVPWMKGGKYESPTFKELFIPVAADLHKEILILIAPPLPIAVRYSDDDPPFKYDNLKWLVDKEVIPVETVKQTAKETENLDLRGYYKRLLPDLKGNSK